MISGALNEDFIESESELSESEGELASEITPKNVAIECIIKRDGREVPFSIEKIANAVFKAANQVGGNNYDAAMEIAKKVEDYIENVLGLAKPTVEQIQDVVEKILIKEGHSRTAKIYILYRSKRTQIREMNTKLMKIYEGLTFNAAKENNVKRENANIDGDTAMGTMLKYGSEGAKQFYYMYVIDPKFAEAHKSGDIHIHDLDFYAFTTTCTQIDIEKLFTDGFSTGHGFLREPNDIRSYAALACIAIQSNQNDQHGGQSIPTFDYGLAPGVRKTYKKIYLRNLAKSLELMCVDKLGEKDPVSVAKSILENVKNETKLIPCLADPDEFVNAEKTELLKICDEAMAEKIHKFCASESWKETNRATYQAMEALIHNLNTMHSRAGAQVPFSSINYGTDTSLEGRMIIENILLAEEAGLGNGETPIFPIHIFKVKDGISGNPGDPNYDLFQLACRVSAKRLFPNFSFLDAPYNLEYYKPGHPETEVAYMGCRTRVMANYYDKTRQITPGRGNLSFTSINLPRIAINAHGNLDLFFDDLGRKLDLCVEQLLHRLKIQSAKKVRNFPFLMGQGVWIDSEKLGIDDEVGEVLKHGTLSIGFIGLAECLKSLIGEHHGESQRAQNLGLEIIGTMRKAMDEATKKYNLNFTLLATPAEGLSGRFVKIDKEKYGVIPGVTDREYYTNSFHVPVYYQIGAFDKIKIEAPYHALTNAGHITYVEVDGDPSKNVEAFEQIIQYMKKCGIGYGSINHPVDRDPKCGYTGIIDNECPGCGRNVLDPNDTYGVERIRRITGYLVGTLDRFNDAKRAEVEDRVKHISFEAGAFGNNTGETE